MKVKKPGGMLGWGLILALAVNLIILAPAARAAGPLENVKGLLEEIQTILQGEATKAKRLELIEKVTIRHLNFREMAKRCLGATWETLSEAQRDEFVHLFSQLLKASYANHLEEFVKAKVTYQGETNTAGCGEVRTVIVRPNDKIPVNFRLQQEPQGWMIYDLVIEGVSTVSNYQGQFERIIHQTSYQGLLGCLKAKLKADCPG